MNFCKISYFFVVFIDSHLFSLFQLLSFILKKSLPNFFLWYILWCIFINVLRKSMSCRFEWIIDNFFIFAISFHFTFFVLLPTLRNINLKMNLLFFNDFIHVEVFPLILLFIITVILVGFFWETSISIVIHWLVLLLVIRVL